LAKKVPDIAPKKREGATGGERSNLNVEGRLVLLRRRMLNVYEGKRKIGDAKKREKKVLHIIRRNLYSRKSADGQDIGEGKGMGRYRKEALFKKRVGHGNWSGGSAHALLGVPLPSR